MLPPDSRTLLVDALRPPAGMRLSRAVALTFTLDFESLLGAPLAFAAHNMRESADPIAAMEAVRRSADRIDVFFQAGHLAMPSRDSGLTAFVEKVVHPVRRPRPGHLFHPKLWAVRYRDDTDGSAAVRLLVLSRNLTTDRSWDICLRLDGEIGTRPYAGNKPLSDLIQRAVGLAVPGLGPERVAQINTLTEDLRRAEWELPDDATAVSFHALGVARGSLPDFSGSKHLVVSPFCTEGGLRRCAPSQNPIVISRQESLDLLPQGTVGEDRTWVLNELAGLPGDDPVSDRDIQSGLHAKVYVIEKGMSARVLLGSANATDAAFGGNVEFLVEIGGTRRSLGIETMTGPEAPFRGLLEPYERQPAAEPDRDEAALQNLVCDLAAIPLTATVHGHAEPFDIHLSSMDILPPADGIGLTVQLYTRRGETRALLAGRPVDVRFDALDLMDVTPYVVLTATAAGGAKASTVVIADLVGDPPGRLDHVLARQIETPEQFLRFLALLLGLGIEPAPGGAPPGSGASGVFGGLGQGVLELMLSALADRPGQLDELARHVARLEATERGRALLPEGFGELWLVIDEARRITRDAVAIAV